MKPFSAVVLLALSSVLPVQAAERIVTRHQGRGTFVATHNANRLMFHFFHIVAKGGAGSGK